MIDIDELFFGTFTVGGQTYEITEDDYLSIENLDEYTDSVDLTAAVKHIVVQRDAKNLISISSRKSKNIKDLRGDYHFSQDPIDFAGTVLIFDGNNTAHRARHTHELSYKNLDVSVSYGVLNMLSAAIKKFDNVTSVIVCWDGGVPEFRYKRIPTYKRRDHSDDESYAEFIRQVQELHNILPKFGVYSLRKLKAEADDLMYHTSRMIHSDYRKIIISTDQDLLQCVNKDTVVWQPNKEVLITQENFKEYTGLETEHFLTYRCMVGDSSDGIPGIKGIGEKIALKLIEDYNGAAATIVNAALGINPEAKPMSASVADKVRNFGIKGFADVMSAIRLDIDNCGVKIDINKVLSEVYEFDPQQVNNYLKSYAFASLMSSQFYDCFKNLRKPILRDNLRYPLVFNSTDRIPVEFQHE